MYIKYLIKTERLEGGGWVEGKGEQRGRARRKKRKDLIRDWYRYHLHHSGYEGPIRPSMLSRKTNIWERMQN
jgi:hypothetical protein